MNHITQVDLEDQLMRICERMDEDTGLLLELSIDRAEAEADYKYKYSRTLINISEKMPVSSKEARAYLSASEEFRKWQLLLAREKATQQSLLAARSRLDAIRTVCANVRAAGG